MKKILTECSKYTALCLGVALMVLALGWSLKEFAARGDKTESEVIGDSNGQVIMPLKNEE